MRLGVIELVSVPVTDQSRSREFYEGKLGFKLISDDQFGDGQRWVQLEPPGAGRTSPWSRGSRRCGPGR